MRDFNRPSETRSLRRGTVAQIATTVFIGIPMTLGLITAVAVYCTFEYAKYKFFVKTPQRVLSDAAKSSAEAFSATLAKMAEVHGPRPSVQPTRTLDQHEAISKVRD